MCVDKWFIRLYFAVFGYFLFVTIFAIASWHGLVADGVNYFRVLLQTRFPTTLESSRIFAHVVTQWPIVLTLRAGVTDITTLLYVHSFGLYYFGPLQLVLCYLIVPRDKRKDLIWPLISLCAASMNGWFQSNSASHIMTYTFWPIILFMLHGKPDQKIYFIVFLCLVFASILFYETMAVQGLVLIGMALWRCHQCSQVRERILWLAVGLWFVLGRSVAIYFILNPRDIHNRDGLMSATFRLAGTHISDLNYPVIISIIALCLIVFLLFVREISGKTFVMLIGAFAIAAVLAAFTPVLIPNSLDQIRQHAARSWIGVLPVGLVLAMIILRRQNANWSAVAFERVMIVVGILAFSQLTWQNLATAQWRGYIKVFQTELSQHEGFIPYEESPMAIQSSGIQVIRKLNWGWTNPLMSIVLAPGGRVSTIFGASPGRW